MQPEQIRRTEDTFMSQLENVSLQREADYYKTIDERLSI